MSLSFRNAAPLSRTPEKYLKLFELARQHTNRQQLITRRVVKEFHDTILSVLKHFKSTICSNL